MKKSISIFAILFSYTTFLYCQEVTVSGSVICENTSVPFAVIYLEEEQKAVVADSTGRYAIVVNAGNHQFTISAIGYESKKISHEILHDLLLDFELTLALIGYKPKAIFMKDFCNFLS